MTTYRVNNSMVLGNFVCAQWVPNTAYALGDRVVCRVSYGTTGRRAYVYECTTAGTSHATTEPTWPTSGTVADNDIVWTTRSPDDGTWANATCILAYITTSAGGNTFLIHKDHNETTNLSATYNIYLGTSLNYARILSVDKDDGDSLAVGAIVESTSSTYVLFRGCGYCYGVSFISHANNIYVGYEPTDLILESDGSDVLTLQGSSGVIQYGVASSPNRLKIINGNINFAYAANAIQVNQGYGSFEWQGGTLVAPNGVSVLFSSGWDGFISIKDVDLSQLAVGVEIGSLLNAATGRQSLNIVIERCKLPASTIQGWRHLYSYFSWLTGGRGRFHHCSFGNKTYGFFEKDYCGEITDETGIVRTGGASDGATPQSWKMLSYYSAQDFLNPLYSPPISIWCPYTTEKTFTIEGVCDFGTNLQNDEIWMELECPANNTDGQGKMVSDRCLPLSSPADKPSSSEVWGVSGIKPIGVSTWYVELDTNTSVATMRSWRTVLAAGTLTTSGSRVRLRLWSGAGTCRISGVSIGLRSGSTSAFNGPPTRVTFNGNNGVTIPGSTMFVLSDWIDFSLDETLSYLVHLFIIDTTSYYRYKGTTGDGCYYKDGSSDDETMVEAPTGFTPVAGRSVCVDYVEVAPAAGSGNKFKCQVTTTPGKAGPVTARICLAKPTAIVYIDPLITIS